MDESRDEQLQLHFESTFFRLLSLLRELKGNIQFEHTDAFLAAHPHHPSTKQEGDDAIEAMLIELAYWDELNPATDDLLAIYTNKIYIHAENGISPYFRVLQNILRSIDSADYLSDIDKVEYGNLLRSQITSNELALAGINALLPGSSRFREYVVKFSLLKYLQAGHIRQTLENHPPAETFNPRSD